MNSADIEVGGWQWDLRKDQLEIDDGFRAILGLAWDSAPRRLEFLCGVIHPEDLHNFQHAVQRLVDGRQSSLRLCHRMLTRWGECRRVDIFGEVLERAASGGALRVGGRVVAAARSEPLGIAI
ncbi:MAG: PAS domain-containing protein [Pseudomonadota bacterium]|nr:PAS domain-containing protein [Pseudomonadota bacterium]